MVDSKRSRLRPAGLLLALLVAGCGVDTGVVATDARPLAVDLRVDTQDEATDDATDETADGDTTSEAAADAADETATRTIPTTETATSEPMPPTDEPAATPTDEPTADAPVSSASDGGDTPGQRRPGTLVATWLCTVLMTAACDTAETETVIAPTTEPAVCEVSDLLVPTCGAWFGVSSPSADGRFDYTRGLAEYDALVAEPPDILRFYQRDGVPFPDAEHRALAERPGEPRSILHFSWKPGFGRTWREIANGAVDANIDAVAASLSAYPHRMFLTIHHEPENDVDQREGSGMTPADYVDMYRYVVEQLRARGVDNVVYVMNYMGFERWRDIVDDLYPGDDVVDWIAWDPYAMPSHSTMTEVINDPDGDWPGFYEWVTAKAPGTPLMLAEWGFDLPTQPWAADAVAELPEVLGNEYPEIRAVVYWNDRGERLDPRIAVDDDRISPFVDAFAATAADPYFNRVSTDLAP